jgi:transcriptional regulator with XRE-family HTH domain
MDKQDIQTIRKQLGLSQREFAEKLEVTRLTIARWESGIMKPNPERLAMLKKLVNDINDTSVSSNDTKNVSSGENVSCNDTNDTTQNDTKSENVSSENVSSNENDTNDTKNDTNISSQSVSSDNIPSEMKEYPHWVCWGIEKRDSKDTKIPYSPHGGKAKSDDPSTWGTFEQAQAYLEQHPNLSGLGFVFADDDPFCGVDLDKCRNPETGEINADAQKMIDDFASYTEISPSGEGVHIIVKGKKKGARARNGKIELYDTGRYFTVTGNVLDGHTTIENRQEQLDKLYDTLFAKKERQSVSTQSQTVSLDDFEIIEKAKSAKDGAKFTALWEGDITGYDSHSEADLALCSLLAFWTGGDYARIDALFRQSGLYREDKWGEREDYRKKTIDAALEQVTEFYDPNYDDGNKEKSEQRRINAQGILSEISLLDEPTPEKIQTKLWDFVTDASYWTPTELGRFCDNLNIEYNITKTWLRSWKRAVITEKRKRSAQVKSLSPTEGEKPTIIVTNRFMREITADIISAINQINRSKPFIFVRSGLPTRVELDENGNAIAKPLTVAAARGIMERAADFVSETDIEGETLRTPVNPPLDNVNDFLSLGSFPDLPPLVGISTAPVVASDGTICASEGYQPKTRYFYHAKPKLEIGDITPAFENVERAKRLILGEVLYDFPFADRASRANTIALMLTPFVRPMVQGATPLHVIDASTPGTGKTLLADIASMPFIPSGPTIMTAGRDDDEWRKRITAKLMNAPSHILIDNVKLKLTSGDLSAALTAHEWEDRILGQSATIRLPVRCVWIATGNNLELSDEIARRSVWIRLEANIERPWERRGFKHENLRGWVRRYRGELVTALLTLVQRWLADGRPEENTVILGSYEEWVKVVGGILKATGIDGFLENATMLYDQLDVERQAWVEFFNVWVEQYGAYDEASSSWGAYVETDTGALVWQEREVGEPVGTKELFLIASHPDDNPNEGFGILDAYLSKGKERARRISLAKQLQKRKRRIFGGYQLEILSTRKDHATLYQLLKITESHGLKYTRLSVCPQSAPRLTSEGDKNDETESQELKPTPCSQTTKASTICVHSERSRTGAGINSALSVEPSDTLSKNSHNEGLGETESPKLTFRENASEDIESEDREVFEI